MLYIVHYRQDGYYAIKSFEADDVQHLASQLPQNWVVHKVTYGIYERLPESIIQAINLTPVTKP